MLRKLSVVIWCPQIVETIIWRIYIYIYIYTWYLHIHDLYTQSKSRQTMSFDYKAQWGLTFWAFKRSVAVVALDLWMCHSLRCFFLVVGFICIFAWLCHKTTLKLTHPLPACTFESMIFRLKPVWWDKGIGSLECSGLKIQGRAPHLHLLRKRSTYILHPQSDGLEKVDSLKIWPFLVSMLYLWGCNYFQDSRTFCIFRGARRWFRQRWNFPEQQICTWKMDGYWKVTMFSFLFVAICSAYFQGRRLVLGRIIWREFAMTLSHRKW